MNKSILMVHTPPNEINPNTYNNQQMGLAKAFCRLGYNFDFITFKKNNQKEWTFFEYNGCKARWIELPRKRLFKWAINKTICDKKFLSNYCFVISQEYYQIMTYMLSKKSDNVVMYSGPYTNLFYTSLMSKFYDLFFTRAVNKNLCCKLTKTVLAKQFLEKKGYTDVNCVGVGLDYERFNDEYGIHSDTQNIVDFMTTNKCILYVGALWSVKNYPFLLKVYEKVHEIDPEIKFVIIGKSKISPYARMLGKSDDSYAEKIESSISSEVKKGILHVRSIENAQLKYIYPLAKAFLLPSKFEIFGMVLLEAMYLGAPVVTTYNGGSSTMIDGRNSGQIIKELDVNLWVDAIFKYINNPDHTSIITRNAREIVSKEYTWDNIANEMMKYIPDRFK